MKSTSRTETLLCHELIEPVDHVIRNGSSKGTNTYFYLHTCALALGSREIIYLVLVTAIIIQLNFREVSLSGSESCLTIMDKSLMLGWIQLFGFDEF